MREGTKKVLDMIDAELLEGNKELWHILSTLRGPDSNSDMEKESTTCIIRRKVFPQTYENSCLAETFSKMKSAGQKNGGFIFGEDCEERRNFRNDLKNFRSSHFTRHVQDAFFALGLHWDKINE